ncbi:MAG: PIN domain-containing protein [Rhizonema sp. PD38]|nr:PIN domain-containing protein [Rhizonema sp. PD38]
MDIYPIDHETAEIYGDFKSEIIKRFAVKEKSKRKTDQLKEIVISENDLWIAATALRHLLVLVTSDSDFQRMRQAREFLIESWI